VSFLNVDDLVVSEVGFSKDCEMMMVGEMSTLDMELVKYVSWCNKVCPYFFDVGVFQLLMPMVVVL